MGEEETDFAMHVGAPTCLETSDPPPSVTQPQQAVEEISLVEYLTGRG
jgi:hypothetical protein